MNCQEVQEMMPSFFDREFDNERWRLIQPHIEACQECLRTWHALQGVEAILQEAPMAIPPPDFVRQTVHRVTRSGRRREWLFGLLTSLVGGAFLMLAGLGMWLIGSGDTLFWLTTPTEVITRGMILWDGARLLLEGLWLFLATMSRVMFDQLLWLTITLSLSTLFIWLFLFHLIRRPMPLYARIHNMR